MHAEQYCPRPLCLPASHLSSGWAEILSDGRSRCGEACRGATADPIADEDARAGLLLRGRLWLQQVDDSIS